MNDEKIFGPLTLKQFIYVAIALGIIYFSYKNLDQNLSIGIAVVVIIVTIFLIRNVAPPPFDETYIRQKKSELGREDFQKWSQRKLAMIHAQIYMRQEKGLVVDPALEKMRQLLESIQSEQ